MMTRSHVYAVVSAALVLDLAGLAVGAPPTGERLVTRERGEEPTMRALVHDLAAEHDLVPIWEDASWMDDGSRRPPAPFYTTRDLAPPSHMALAS